MGIHYFSLDHKKNVMIVKKGSYVIWTNLFGNDMVIEIPAGRSMFATCSRRSDEGWGREAANSWWPAFEPWWLLSREAPVIKSAKLHPNLGSSRKHVHDLTKNKKMMFQNSSHQLCKWLNSKKKNICYSRVILLIMPDFFKKYLD